jgi:hypothetical protein
MRKAFVVAAAILVASLAPSDACAWGFTGHRLIMSRAIDLLPPELKPFYEHYRTEIVIRAIDPDLWRSAGWDEDPNHFLDLGVKEYGSYPFRELPRELDGAVEKFGPATVKRYGVLPWRTTEMFGNLRRTFERLPSAPPYAPSDLMLFSAAAGHYVQDAHQPFHATDNFDGQQTGNDGVHTRFERDLVEKFESRLMLRPSAPKQVPSVRDFVFDALLTSHRQVDAILKADTESIAGKDTYDGEYFERMFARARPILEERLSAAITATASIILTAWEQAGRPQPPLEGARPVETVKKPQR